MGDASEPTYHQRVRQEKRTAILRAATARFLAAGYEGASLASVAEEAGVSTATLFKRFPTKAALFDAIVGEHWVLQDRAQPEPPAGDPEAGLREFGRHYAELLGSPDMVGLFRIVIAEAPRFPELAERHFAVGKMPFWRAVLAYIEREADAGTLVVDDAELATTHFLGMIATFVFWPRMLLVGYAPRADEVRAEVDEAVRTTLARYAP